MQTGVRIEPAATLDRSRRTRDRYPGPTTSRERPGRKRPGRRPASRSPRSLRLRAAPRTPRSLRRRRSNRGSAAIGRRPTCRWRSAKRPRRSAWDSGGVPGRRTSGNCTWKPDQEHRTPSWTCLWTNRRACLARSTAGVRQSAMSCSVGSLRPPQTEEGASAFPPITGAGRCLPSTPAAQPSLPHADTTREKALSSLHFRAAGESDSAARLRSSVALLKTPRDWEQNHVRVDNTLNSSSFPSAAGGRRYGFSTEQSSLAASLGLVLRLLGPFQQDRSDPLDLRRRRLASLI